ncbi:hypothetical protein AX17_007508 [Amanita inopinata Kibby_2008]|nr:hypothetical protein AX17_007508 [Amanita inopinata Kibby_2008]
MIRQEMEVATAELEKLRAQRDDYELKVNAQVHELSLIRRSFYDLENHHNKLRQQYEQEINQLRLDISHLRGAPPSSLSASNTHTHTHTHTHAHPHPHTHTHPTSNPITGTTTSHLGPSPHGSTCSDSRESVRDRDRDHPLYPLERAAPQLGRNHLVDPEREMDRLSDHRNAKRFKSRADPYDRSSPVVQLASPPRMPSVVAHNTAPPPPGPRVPLSSSSSSSSSATPDHPMSGPPMPLHDIRNEAQGHGPSWTVMHNAKVPRKLDITLLHTLTHGSVVCCVQFSADGRWVATGCNRSARIYDTKTGQQKWCVDFANAQESVLPLYAVAHAFPPSGAFVGWPHSIVCGNRHHLPVFGIGSCLIDDTVAATSGDLYIRSVRFSPDGKYLATGAEDRKIRIWDIGGGRIWKTFVGHQQEIYSLDFSRDGRWIVSGSGDRTARVWDLGDKPPKVFAITDAATPNSDSYGQDTSNTADAGVTSVAISHDSRLIAAGSLDTIVRVWDVASGQLLARLRGHADSVYSVAFSADGCGLVSGSLDKTLKYWDVGAVVARVRQGHRQSGSPGGGKRSVSPVKLEMQAPERPVSPLSTMNFIGHKVGNRSNVPGPVCLPLTP